MVVVAWLLIMLLLSMFFGGWLDNADNPNRDPEIRTNGNSTELVLRQDRSGHYVVDGLINNSRATLFLDTGATSVVVPMELASEFGLDRGPSVRVSTANGEITSYVSRIDRLVFGDIVLTNVEALLNPAMDRDDEILLGMSALSELDMVQRDGQLVLTQYR